MRAMWRWLRKNCSAAAKDEKPLYLHPGTPVTRSSTTSCLHKQCERGNLIRETGLPVLEDSDLAPYDNPIPTVTCDPSGGAEMAGSDDIGGGDRGGTAGDCGDTVCRTACGTALRGNEVVHHVTRWAMKNGCNVDETMETMNITIILALTTR